MIFDFNRSLLRYSLVDALFKIHCFVNNDEALPSKLAKVGAQLVSDCSNVQCGSQWLS
jgi:hypothetical protein